MGERAAWRASGVFLAVCLAGACVSYSDVRFAPPIQDAELRDGSEVQARIAVAWRGVEEHDGGYELCLRCRVDNPRAEPFAIAPAEFELVDAALAALGPARAQDLPVAVDPGREATFDLRFPLPAGRTPDDPDLSTLQLRVSFDHARWHWSTSFQRLVRAPYPYPYYDPWWDSPWHFSAGVFWCHRH